MGQVSYLLLPLQKRRLPLCRITDPPEFDEEAAETAHVGLVRCSMVFPEAQHLLKRNRRQV